MNPQNDPFIFYSITISSLLESTADTFVENLEHYYGDNTDFLTWLKDIWLPDELGHGELTKEYVTRQWPGFDWDKAYSAFYEAYKPKCHYSTLRKNRGLEALSRCVTETEAAMMYRCIGNYSDDKELGLLMKKLSKDEVRHYTRFRKVYEMYDQKEKNSLYQKAKVIVKRSQLVRDEDISLAFQVLNSSWKGDKPFTEITFDEFLNKTGHIMHQYFPYDEAKRMLLKPLKTGGTLNGWMLSWIALAIKRLYPTPA